MPRLHMVLVNQCWIRCSIALIIKKELVHRRQMNASHSRTTTDALRNSDHNQPDRNQHSLHRARRHPAPYTHNCTTAQPKPTHQPASTTTSTLNNRQSCSQHSHPSSPSAQASQSSSTRTTLNSQHHTSTSSTQPP